MKKGLITSILALTFGSLQAQPMPPSPKLVVTLTIDQLRTDYMEAFSSLYGERGFKRLLREGKVFRQMEYSFNVTDRAELGAIKHRFPAGLAVDMESAAIAQVCHLYGIPFLSFRIISDTPGVEDHSAQYADFWGTMAERSFLSTWAFLSTLPDSL